MYWFYKLYDQTRGQARDRHDGVYGRPLSQQLDKVGLSQIN